MRKVFISAAFIFLAGGVFGQGKFTVPELSFEQKHERANSQIPAFLAAGINIAKTLDVTPYEYGKKIGNLFALTWDKEAGIADYMGCEITREDTKQPSRITIKKK